MRLIDRRRCRRQLQIDTRCTHSYPASSNPNRKLNRFPMFGYWKENKTIKQIINCWFYRRSGSNYVMFYVHGNRSRFLVSVVHKTLTTGWFTSVFFCNFVIKCLCTCHIVFCLIICRQLMEKEEKSFFFSKFFIVNFKFTYIFLVHHFIIAQSVSFSIFFCVQF